MKRPPVVLFYLLCLLAILMGAHLLLLSSRDQGCRQYERVLLDRLLQVPAGSPEARNIRNEIQNFFDGRYGDCSRTALEFGEASDKYLAVLLSLLTGAGIAGGVAMGRESELTDQLMEDAARKEDDLTP